MNRIIDIHTHMFNGRFLPLKDIFHHTFELSKLSAWALAVIVNWLVNSQPRGDFRGEDENEGWKSFADYSEDAQLDDFAEYMYNALAKHLAEDLSDYNRNKALSNTNSSELLQAYLYLIEEDAQPEDEKFDKADFKLRIADHLQIKDDLRCEAQRLKDLDDLFRDRGERALKRVLGELCGYISFLGKMLLHEEQLMEHLIGKNYSEEQRPELTIHHMMDMEPAYCELEKKCTPPKYLFRSEQIPRAEKAVSESDGRLLGFVAFDPRRGPEALDIVTECLAARRYIVGVKLYPPMNYRPNDIDRYPVLEDLYVYCIEKHIPIMTHCTPVGFEAKKGFGLNSDPDYWEDVLVLDKKRFKDLRLCFGHAGGGDYEVGPLSFNGWYETDDNLWNSEQNYARKVIKLCQKHPNVYADMSYLHAMIHSADKRDTFIRRLKDALGIQPEREEPCDFGDKMIYGSDWPMADIVNNTNKYLDMFQDIFADEDLSGYRDRFFFLNAIKFLNLEDYVEGQINSSQPVHSTLGLSHLKQMATAAKKAQAPKP